ncbi:hypothetical protein FRB91_002931 [Serendipita sp. 411]|nr:hypothetical protein FRB91_002931 [Serendipita sp. 411]
MFLMDEPDHMGSKRSKGGRTSRKSNSYYLGKCLDYYLYCIESTKRKGGGAWPHSLPTLAIPAINQDSAISSESIYIWVQNDRRVFFWDPIFRIIRETDIMENLVGMSVQHPGTRKTYTLIWRITRLPMLGGACHNPATRMSSASVYGRRAVYSAYGHSSVDVGLNPSVNRAPSKLAYIMAARPNTQVLNEWIGRTHAPLNPHVQRYQTEQITEGNLTSHRSIYFINDQAWGQGRAPSERAAREAAATEAVENLDRAGWNIHSGRGGSTS